MADVTYVTGKTGAELTLESSSTSIEYGGGLRSAAWSYELAARGPRNVTRAARDVKVSCVCSEEDADSILKAFADDVASKTPGMLVVPGDWRQSCYVMAYDGVQYVSHVGLSLTVTLLDGYWWREQTRELFAQASAGGLDHPYDHPYDLGHQSGRAVIEVGGTGGAAPRITFRGPATNPYVIIGSNRYEADESVPSGGRVVIDATAARPTVTLYDRMGNASDVFASAVRDGGPGGGSYAFEDIPCGTHEVTWSGGFGMEIAWREREMVPPWSQ